MKSVQKLMQYLLRKMVLNASFDEPLPPMVTADRRLVDLGRAPLALWGIVGDGLHRSWSDSPNPLLHRGEVDRSATSGGVPWEAEKFYLKKYSAEYHEITFPVYSGGISKR